jgi:hypothetical protein
MQHTLGCPFFRKALVRSYRRSERPHGIGGGEFRLPVLVHGVGFGAKSAVPLLREEKADQKSGTHRVHQWKHHTPRWRWRVPGRLEPAGPRLTQAASRAGAHRYASPGLRRPSATVCLAGQRRASSSSASSASRTGQDAGRACNLGQRSRRSAGRFYLPMHDMMWCPAQAFMASPAGFLGRRFSPRASRNRRQPPPFEIIRPRTRTCLFRHPDRAASFAIDCKQGGTPARPSQRPIRRRTRSPESP